MGGKLLVFHKARRKFLREHGWQQNPKAYTTHIEIASGAHSLVTLSKSLIHAPTALTESLGAKQNIDSN